LREGVVVGEPTTEMTSPEIISIQAIG